MNTPAAVSSERVFELMRAANPELHDALAAPDLDAFCDAAERALVMCLKQFEDTRKLRGTDSELRLSTDLTDRLTCMGFDAVAEAYANGHVDVTIRHKERGRFRMLGECKIYRYPAYHCAGVKQVLGYCSGSDRRVFCLDFVQKLGIKKIVEGLREHTESSDPCHQVHDIEDCDHPWSFRAAHLHSSGEHVDVLHLCCDLFHASNQKVEALDAGASDEPPTPSSDCEAALATD